MLCRDIRNKIQSLTPRLIFHESLHYGEQLLKLIKQKHIVFSIFTDALSINWSKPISRYYLKELNQIKRIETKQPKKTSRCSFD